MAERIPTIVQDDRPIKALYFNDAEDNFLQLGTGTVKEFRPYEENGEMAPVTWIAVIDFNDKIARRIPARMVEIEYGN